MKTFWRQTGKLYRLSILSLLFFLLLAIVAPFAAPYNPDAVSMHEILQPSTTAHLLGTDALGRDIWSRLIYGTRISVSFAAASALCTMLLGVTLGMVGGYFGGWIDKAIQFMTTMVQGLPGMSLMVAIAAIMPEGNFRLIVAVTLTSWAGISRIVRSEVLRIKKENYMEGIRCIGGSTLYILRKYVYPNVLPVILMLLTLRIGRSLLSASALSYLGLGVTPPTADWGVMINDARTYFRSFPLQIIAPGLAITLFCISINLVGDAWREYIGRDRAVDWERRQGNG